MELEKIISEYTVFWMLILIGWLYSVGSAANAKLPGSLKKGTTLYMSGFAVAILYSTLLAVFFFPSVGIAPNQPAEPPVWLVPLHLLSMLGMFYGLWFTAKQFSALQKNEDVKFIDYSGPFFLFWFSPVGVWFLQPRINDLLGEIGHNKQPKQTP